MIATLTKGAGSCLLFGLISACGTSARGPDPVPTAPATTCLPSGDGYLRAKLGGSVTSNIDWPNSGTQCEGESRGADAGVRLSFKRSGAKPDLLIVFGLPQVRAGQPAKQIGANLTVIVQGTDKIFGTLGDSRCTVDSLKQDKLPRENAYRIEARGFCVQPAHAVRGDGDVLMTTFEFAGPVLYAPEDLPTQEQPT